MAAAAAALELSALEGAAEALAEEAVRVFADGIRELAFRSAAAAKAESRRLAEEEAHRLSIVRQRFEEERLRIEGACAEVQALREHLEEERRRLGVVRRQLGENVWRTQHYPTTSINAPLPDLPDNGWGIEKQHGGPLRYARKEPVEESNQLDEVWRRLEDWRVLPDKYRKYPEEHGRLATLEEEAYPEEVLPRRNMVIQGHTMAEFDPDFDKQHKHEPHELQSRASHGIPEHVPFSFNIDGYWYAVLPLSSPGESNVLQDMFGVTVTLPRGWEVLSTKIDGFEDVIAELTKHGWGTSLLCVQNEFDGFSSFRTRLYTHGSDVGSLLAAESRVLQLAFGGGREFQFSKGMVLSGRLVIRTVCRQDSFGGA